MKIAFLGDSITLGYALEERERDRFPAVLCRMTGHEEQNLGITGTLVAQAGLSRSDGYGVRGSVSADRRRGCRGRVWRNERLFLERHAHLRR